MERKTNPLLQTIVEHFAKKNVPYNKYIITVFPSKI
jgi:hypothetical protein